MLASCLELLEVAMSKPNADTLIGLIREGLAGRRTMVPGPFGARPLVYADYTASGRSLDFIERAMAQKVLPHYANTHTETSYTGLQTTRFREQARGAIRRAVGADERHAVIFCGSGATAAINKLVNVMGLRRALPEGAARPVVFVGPYEHHSNDLIWRESAVTLVRIPLDEEGMVCMGTLEAALEEHKDAPLKIGSFSAASNVTGVRTDMGRLGEMLARHDALFLADYAAAGPYLDIDMGRDRIDAMFLSPHKFVGGPGASGVLVARRALLECAVPSVPGGGTVAYVSAGMHRYVGDVERREEAGTPAILGDIRAGMAMQLKADIGAEAIEAREKRAIETAFAAWKQEPNIEILGPAGAERLAIFSLNIRQSGRHLHPNFVVALLNDLFGIQARGGCSCAGPYGHDLLGISDARAQRYDALLQAGLNVFRPGWALPFLQRIGRLHVVMPIDQHGWRAGCFAPLGDHRRMPARWHDLDLGKSGLAHPLGDELRCGRNPLGKSRIGADAGNAAEGHHIGQRLRFPSRQISLDLAHLPPSTLKIWPEIHPACSEAKNITALAISSGDPRRLSAILLSSRCCPSSPMASHCRSVVGLERTKPGATLLTVIPHGPSSCANCRVSPICPALALA
jgi:selenocysteine lyase/cysteine desulfurase